MAPGHRILLEIGPSPVLQSYLHDALRAGETQGRVLATLGRKDADRNPFPAIAARCHVAGHDLAGAPWFDGTADPRGLPLYPWQRERFWYDITVEGPDLVNPQFLHPLLGFRAPGPLPAWVNYLDPELLPWLADHAIEGVPVLPAAAVLEMALAAARSRRPDARALELADVELRRPLPFDKGRTRELRTRLDAEDGVWELSSRPRLSDEALTVHAVARIVTGSEGAPAATRAPGGPLLREIDGAALYRLAARLGLDYGPGFRTVTRIAVLAPDEAVVALDPAARSTPPLDLYLIHPALLDGALQGLLALIAENAGRNSRGASFLPWRFGRVRLSALFARVPRARASARDPARRALGLRRHRAVRRRRRRRRRAYRMLVPPRRADPRRVDRRSRPARRPGAGAARRRRGRPRRARRDRRRVAGPHRPAGDAIRNAAPNRRCCSRRLRRRDSGAAIRGIAGPDAAFTVDDLVESGRIAPDAAPVVEAALGLLARLGAAELDDGGEWRLFADSGLPETDEIWRLLLAEAPELVAELTLTAAGPNALSQVLAEGRPGPSAPDPLDASPVTAAGVGVVCDMLRDIAAAWPRGRARCACSNSAPVGRRRGVRSMAWRSTGSPCLISPLARTPTPRRGSRSRSRARPARRRGAGPLLDADDAFSIPARSMSCCRSMPAPG